MITPPNTPVGREVGALTGNTPDELAAAARYVHGRATSPADEQQLLDTLGLHPAEAAQ
ncbi:hypothetical protein ACIQGZ_17475 [Streptomyces sp. NPDC092296]|uniref:hypothetical protein n=1 Tax=Streptomyces sp. NPDC092296 TaxID=3366012 RepID=UPI0038007624